MNQAVANFAAWLPVEGADELFRDGIPTAATAFHPLAAATRVEGGWRITGQVPFASGCRNVKWLAMPAAEMEGGQPKIDPASGKSVPFVAFFPRGAASIEDTWHTTGMRGTGSADIVVRDLVVPDQMTAMVGPLRNPSPGFEGPLYRIFPLHGVLGEAIVSVGVAAAAVDEAVHLCKRRHQLTMPCRCASSNWPNIRWRKPKPEWRRHATRSTALPMPHTTRLR